MQCRLISDTHLFDSYSLGWRSDLGSLEDYANLLITEWNEFTAPDDMVIMVGDIGYYCQRTIETLMRLKGRKILVIGNHDTVWGTAIYNGQLFQGIHTEINVDGMHIEHHPYGDRNGAQFYVHGHHHRYDMPGMYKHLLLYSKDTCRLNCASDLIGHRPRTIQELILCKEVMLDKYKSKHLLQEVI